MDEIKIIALKNGQIIIGKPEIEETSGKIKRIISPRNLIPNKNGGVIIMELWGTPDVLTLTDETIYVSDVKEKQMLEVYIKATTGLTLVS